jgi:hypothetical protein
MSIDLSVFTFSREINLSPALQGELLLILEVRLGQLCSDAYQNEPERLKRIESALDLVNKLRNLKSDQPSWAEWVFRHYTVRRMELSGIPKEFIPQAPEPFLAKNGAI